MATDLHLDAARGFLTAAEQVRGRAKRGGGVGSAVRTETRKVYVYVVSQVISAVMLMVHYAALTVH